MEYGIKGHKAEEFKIAKWVDSGFIEEIRPKN